MDTKLIVAGLFTLLSVSGAALAQGNHQQHVNAHVSGQFDYFKMTFSREREWCYAKGISAAKCQAGPEYVVHGLWPEYQHGHPESCELATPGMSDTDAAVEAEIAKVIPVQIVEHEWSVHGRCSGLSRSSYFGEVIRINKAVKLPTLPKGDYTVAQIKDLIIKSNSGMSSKNIQLSCHENGKFTNANSQTLDEIRFCYRSDLKGFENCSGESDQ
jgi:ribonuclease T2